MLLSYGAAELSDTCIIKINSVIINMIAKSLESVYVIEHFIENNNVFYVGESDIKKCFKELIKLGWNCSLEDEEWSSYTKLIIKNPYNESAFGQNKSAFGQHGDIKVNLFHSLNVDTCVWNLIEFIAREENSINFRSFNYYVQASCCKNIIFSNKQKECILYEFLK